MKKKTYFLEMFRTSKTIIYKSSIFFKEKNHKRTVYITFLSNDFKVSQRMSDSEGQIPKSLYQISSFQISGI